MSRQHHKFEIGTQYLSTGKCPRLCTVTEQLRVVDSKDNVVKIFYQSQHEFAGQTVTNHDVPETTIARGVFKLTNTGETK